MRFCETADVQPSEVLAWSPLALEALDEAEPHLSKEIAPSDEWADATRDAFTENFSDLTVERVVGADVVR
jgi:hypothetical protein